MSMRMMSHTRLKPVRLCLSEYTRIFSCLKQRLHTLLTELYLCGLCLYGLSYVRA